jgi:hypothetical protein
MDFIDTLPVRLSGDAQMFTTPDLQLQRIRRDRDLARDVSPLVELAFRSMNVQREVLCLTKPHTCTLGHVVKSSSDLLPRFK